MGGTELGGGGMTTAFGIIGNGIATGNVGLTSTGNGGGGTTTGSTGFASTGNAGSGIAGIENGDFSNSGNGMTTAFEIIGNGIATGNVGLMTSICADGSTGR